MGTIFGSSRAAQVERLGNSNGKYEMRIQYCGGWGYKKNATAVQREVEKMHPQIFEYVLTKDSGVTGNLEITLCKKGASVDNQSASGSLVHSKRGG